MDNIANPAPVRFVLAATELTRWLRTTDWDAAAARVRGWNDATWRQAPRVLYLHTLTPWIVPILAQQPALAAALPEWLHQHLATLHAWGQERSRLQQDELAAILRSAERACIALLP